MSRFDKMFRQLKEKGEGAYVPFFVLGDPDYETSLDLMKLSIDEGADALELGLWFSDPIADGPSVQKADVRARDSGMNVGKAFSLIKKVREYSPNTPFGMLVYYQLVLFANKRDRIFCKEVYEAGADGILIPDLPIEYIRKNEQKEHSHEEEINFDKLENIFLVAPSTIDERVDRIASVAKGFIYQVAREGVTGASLELEEKTLHLIERTRKYTDKYNQTPIVVGFGISKPEHVRSVLKAGADGAITGSALCDIIDNNLNNKSDMYNSVREYVKLMKQATIR